MMRLKKPPVSSFTDESRIIAEGQKDGERNIPEMGSYTPAQFEQALIANGEQEVHRLYKSASMRIARLAPLFHAWHRRLQDIERRSSDLNGEPEYLTYVMASTLAITIPLVGVFIGIHLRHSIPRTAGNILVGLLTPIAVGGALFAISVLRNTYIFSQVSQAAPAAASSEKLAYALFALNILVFFAAMVASFFAHDPDEKLDFFHHSLLTLDRKRHAIRKKLYAIGTKINGEIQQAKSQVEQARALTNERVALYRQTNMRFRRLLPPPSFRKNPEFPPLEWWPEVSLNSEDESAHVR